MKSDDWRKYWGEYVEEIRRIKKSAKRASGAIKKALEERAAAMKTRLPEEFQKKC